MPSARWLGVVALCVAGCSSGKPKNVLLISIDTLRADHVGAYGFQKDTTPHIDALAAEGVRFDDVLTTVPLTLPAHSSLLTGSTPPVHGVHDNLGNQLADAHTTLAELLRSEGFATGAIVSSFVLDSRFNLSQGFDTYNDAFEEEHKIAFLSERKGGETTRLAASWLEEHHHRPFFLFLHYYDPHDDYDPPPPFDTRFPGDPYAGEVAFVDRQVGDVLDELARLGVDDETLVVVTGDHGEMLDEHGEPTHGWFVYQSALRIPLVVRGPGVAPGVVSAPAGIIDIAPTIASLIGLRFPTEVEGRDLAAWAKGEKVDTEWPERRELYVESVTPNRYYGLNPLVGIVTDRYKLIETTRPELYDLVEDPGETTNIIEREPRIAAGLRERVSGILESAAESPEAELDAEARQRLSSLGYLGSSGGDDTGIGVEPGRGDPKDWIGFYRDHQRLEKLVEDERFDEARSLVESMLAIEPSFAAGRLQLAHISTETGELDAAAVHYREALALEPENVAAHFRLGDVLVEAGEKRAAAAQFRRVIDLDPRFAEARERLAGVLFDLGDREGAVAALGDSDSAHARVLTGIGLAADGSLDEAAAAFREVLALDPSHLEAHLQLGAVLARRGRLDEAVAHYRRALDLAPSSAEAHNRLGLALREQGDLETARQHLEQAVAVDPKLASAQNNLGLVLKELGREDEALDHYREALAIDPDFAPAHNNMGSLLGSRGRLSEALAHFRRAVEADPDYEDAQNNLGLALRMTGARDEAVGHFRAALRRRPEWAEPMSELAWILATHPDPASRNPSEAVRLAERAVELTGGRDPLALDALGAAHAANGEFAEAVEVAEKAAGATSSRELAAEIEKRASLYRAGRPFTE